MKLCMIGTGYVGLVSGVCFSDLGNTVYCVDNDINKINSLNRFIKKNNDFIRIFSAGVRTLELDSNGRFLVPIDLINNSDLKKNIVMASAINIIEIWDKDNYEKSINDKNIDFVKLTEQVMGNQNNELS